MEEQFIPLNLAKSLKELGFKEQCLGVYLNNHLEIINGTLFNGTNIKLVEAPLWQQGFQWCLKEHNLSGEIYFFNKRWHFDIMKIDSNLDVYLPLNIDYSTFNEAKQECLSLLIQTIKNNED